MRLSLFGLAILLAGAPVAQAADPIFSPSVLHDVRLQMDPADWQTLKDNYLLDDYYAADVTLDGESFAQAGVRSRGSGSRSPIKPALTIAFDKYRKSADFHGIKSLAIKNLVQDTSMLREALAMPVFEAMGIAAPKVSFARLSVNGEPYGVYNIIEYVDNVFLNNRFGDSSGNLFKYEWNGPYAFEWRGSDPGYYSPDPFKPENHKSDPDPSGIEALIDTINNSPDETFLPDIANYIDPKQFLTYVAVENALAESDGVLSSDGLNNFYLYQLPGSSRFVLVPWDKNTSLQAPAWPLFSNVDSNLLAQRLLTDPALRDFYAQAVMAAAVFFVKPAFLGPIMDSSYALIRGAALADDKKPYTNDEFELAVVGLRGIVASRQADVLSQVGVPR